MYHIENLLIITPIKSAYEHYYLLNQEILLCDGCQECIPEHTYSTYIFLPSSSASTKLALKAATTLLPLSVTTAVTLLGLIFHSVRMSLTKLRVLLAACEVVSLWTAKLQHAVDGQSSRKMCNAQVR